MVLILIFLLFLMSTFRPLEWLKNWYLASILPTCIHNCCCFVILPNIGRFMWGNCIHFWSYSKYIIDIAIHFYRSQKTSKNEYIIPQKYSSIIMSKEVKNCSILSFNILFIFKQNVYFFCSQDIAVTHP
jgi:hypothetical protein